MNRKTVHFQTEIRISKIELKRIDGWRDAVFLDSGIGGRKESETHLSQKLNFKLFK